MRSFWAILLVALTSLSCSYQREGHEWLRPRPAQAVHAKWETLGPARFHEVAPELREEANGLLKAEAGRLLSHEEVQRFVKNPLGDLTRRWYLVRGVRTPEPTGEFQVMTLGRGVTVIYKGHTPRNETVKTALVAQLEQSPDAFYIEVSISPR